MKPIRSLKTSRYVLVDVQKVLRQEAWCDGIPRGLEIKLLVVANIPSQEVPGLKAKEERERYLLKKPYLT